MSNLFVFKKAERKGILARIALDGPTGSGKTYSGLAICSGLVSKSGKRIAVIDTERSSSDRYADLFDFDRVNLTSFSPDMYVSALESIDPAIYGATMIDSLSHAWIGKDGALQQVDRAAARTQGNSFVAWREVTPMHNRLVDALMGHSTHLVSTMRSKMEYVLEKNEEGKQVPRRVGMAPIQREGMEYEFDVVGDMDLNNNLIISKTRMPFLNRAVIQYPDAKLGVKILEFCGEIEPTVSEFDLIELARLGVPAEIKELCMEMYGGRGPKEINPSELTKLRAEVIRRKGDVVEIS